MTKFVFGLLVALIINQINARILHSEKSPILNVAVIGAGTSGMASAKHTIAQGFDVTIYEQGEELGGVWWYTDKTGKDQYGVDIHTAMYQGLRYTFQSNFIEIHTLKIPFRN